MPLVEYSDSDSEHEWSIPEETANEAGSVPLKTTTKDPIANHQKPLPPPPASFHNLYATATRVSTSDDPALHSGRKRITPHVEGNWPSHVYIECKLETLDLSLASARGAFR